MLAFDVPQRDVNRANRTSDRSATLLIGQTIPRYASRQIFSVLSGSLAYQVRTDLPVDQLPYAENSASFV